MSFTCTFRDMEGVGRGEREWDEGERHEGEE